MSDLKQLIQIVRAVQKEGWQTLSSSSQHGTEWLLEAASAVLALRCIPEQFKSESEQLHLTVYVNDAKPSQNLVVVSSPNDDEWVSIPLRVFNGHTAAALTMQAVRTGGAHPVQQYHDTDCKKARTEGERALWTEGDERVWCLLWKLMDRIDAFKVPQVLSFSKYGDRQRGALDERLSLMGAVATYHEMADANLIP
jgi:hypothetical protein